MKKFEDEGGEVFLKTYELVTNIDYCQPGWIGTWGSSREQGNALTLRTVGCVWNFQIGEAVNWPFFGSYKEWETSLATGGKVYP